MGQAIGVARNLCWGPENNRGAEDAEIEMLKASRGEWYGEGVSPFPSDKGVWGAS